MRRKKEENPFKNDVKCHVKGFSAMYNIAPRQEQERTAVPSEVKSSLSLAQQLIAFVELLLIQAQPQSRQPCLRPQQRRGRRPTLPLEQIYLALIKGVICQAQHLSTIWRSLAVEPTGSFPAVQVTYEGLRKRLLSAGMAPLQQLFERLSLALAHWIEEQHPQMGALAAFAKAIVVLDETTLDALRRLTTDLRDVPKASAHLLAGKLAVLFDVRTQRWARVQFRADVLAGCSVGILLLLEGLAPGTLILADLGYFSFPWFDYLTQQGFYWVSRLKTGTTYQIVQVLAYDDQQGILDAIVWLGKYRANRAGAAVRLVIFCWHGLQYRYLTNVLDPALLPMQDIAQLYARRWDIELAFKLLKRELGLALWWGACPQLVLLQVWVALIVAQLLHALQWQVALHAEVDRFDISLPLLIELLPKRPPASLSIIDLMVERGRALGLIRPSSRTHAMVPQAQMQRLPALPAHPPRPRHARYEQRNGHPRTAPFVSHFLTQLLI